MTGATPPESGRDFLAGWSYFEKRALAELVHRTAREQRWYCWIAPAVAVMDPPDWEAQFNWQSYWTSVGLKYEGDYAMWVAFYRVREAIETRLAEKRAGADRAARLAARWTALMKVDAERREAGVPS